MLYGYRPQVPEVWYLSPYEFVSSWEPVMVKYPMPWKAQQSGEYHATLTEDGLHKLKAQEQGEVAELIAGVDYVVKDKGQDWYAFPNVPSTAHFRDTWAVYN